ncbi:probable NAD(P)H-dependent oxidoreductase 1 [Salvia splendens]|uniref:probable NAD(P)H-dependent oxidoreductase 1 n=1 Tax=Salvia splendens TaxID=180675 RepID=UPI001C257FC0|nr:probable NAD(P)H-dependent oxidoreductase 1 [Salvia splendens]XP_042037506.1 probable NAD(P)H-dependent oxidoreductase 1 [Salvia splendens]XP_042037507.1 probable NAD(P)H-dependent oxidoreductase 1 [Salvia splendens]
MAATKVGEVVQGQEHSCRGLASSRSKRCAFWGTLAVMESPVLKEIAASRNKTVPQVALRWIIEQGVTPIVKSYNKEMMKANLEIFNWELSEEDICKIQTIPQAKAFKGDRFIIQDHGDYNSVEEPLGRRTLTKH